MTLVEVVVVLATVVLLLMTFVTRVTRCKNRSPRISCTSNLKQVGLAYRLWSNDHEDQFPFASTNDAGTFRFANSPQVFLHFSAMSNELVMPKVLVCLEDKKRVKAADFTQFSNANLSYFVGLDAREDQPQSILSGDRNVTGGTLSNRFMRRFTSTSEAQWTDEIHRKNGNIGLGDGSVQQVNSQGLNALIQAFTNVSVVRFAIP